MFGGVFGILLCVVGKNQSPVDFGKQKKQLGKEKKQNTTHTHTHARTLQNIFKTKTVELYREDVDLFFVY